MRKALALLVASQKTEKNSLQKVSDSLHWELSQMNFEKDTLFLVERLRPNIIFFDIETYQREEFEFIDRVKQISPETLLVLLLCPGFEFYLPHNKLERVYDILVKPLEQVAVEKLFEKVSGRLGFTRKDEFPSSVEFKDLIGYSSSMKALRRQIKAVAPRNSWVLLTGENGTGKEVVASNLHLSSNRANRPFVAVNCAALPENLIESELFGYREGAFAHAYYSKLGKFELAHKGTLFLDEIGDMSLRTQSKILRILQEQSFERLGDHRPISVDVRVIAATNKNLDEEIKKGTFRKDLFYRLNVVPMHVPPLREREDDVLMVADYFLAEIATEHGCERKALSPSAEGLLLEYPWPGNVREVKNLMERLSVMVSEDEIEDYHILEFGGFSSNDEGESLPLSDFARDINLSLKDARLQFEKEFILRRLTGLRGNVSKTADAIGIERSHLYRKLRLYGIDVKGEGRLPPQKMETK